MHRVKWLLLMPLFHLTRNAGSSPGCQLFASNIGYSINHIEVYRQLFTLRIMANTHKSYSKLLARESVDEEDSEIMEPEQLKWHSQNRRAWRIPVTAVLLLSNFLTFVVTGGVLVYLATRDRYCPSELPKPPCESLLNAERSTTDDHGSDLDV